MSDSLRPHGLQSTRLLRPWDFPGKSTGVGCHCLLRTQAADKNDVPWTFLSPVTENLPVSAGDTGSAYGWEDPTSYRQLSLCARPLSPHTLTLMLHDESSTRSATGDSLDSGAALCFTTKPKREVLFLSYAIAEIQIKCVHLITSP